MPNQKYSQEFRDEAVRQVVDRGYAIKDVAKSLGVPAHNLYKWLKQVRPDPERRQQEELLEAKRENLKLRVELRRVEEERDILKKAALVSSGQRNANVLPRWRRLRNEGSKTYGSTKSGIMAAMASRDNH